MGPLFPTVLWVSWKKTMLAFKTKLFRRLIFLMQHSGLGSPMLSSNSLFLEENLCNFNYPQTPYSLEKTFAIVIILPYGLTTWVYGSWLYHDFTSPTLFVVVSSFLLYIFSVEDLFW